MFGGLPEMPCLGALGRPRRQVAVCAYDGLGGVCLLIGSFILQTFIEPLLYACPHARDCGCAGESCACVPSCQ